MSFIVWKDSSALFKAFRARAEVYNIGDLEAFQAAYRAGQRQGKREIKLIARQAVDLLKSSNHD